MELSACWGMVAPAVVSGGCEVDWLACVALVLVTVADLVVFEEAH